MEEGIISSPSPEPKVLEDVPELMQHIQLCLPVKAAAQTSVLSKSWLHAWSTIPTLRFLVPKKQETKELKLVYIDNTLIRYLRDNIPIERFHLNIKVESEKHASLAEKWIRSVASKTCLKELSLTIYVNSFNLPDEILSGENVTKISVSAGHYWICCLIFQGPPIINCVSLRELNLCGVRIRQELLDNILSSCRLLVKIELKHSSRYLKTIKINSLPCLNELEIVTADIRIPSVEINNVPNLCFFSCNLHDIRMSGVSINPHSISLGSSVTQLSLGGPGLVTDDASLDMIKSGFPFLESLTLIMTYWTMGSFHFTCASIKKFSLLDCPYSLINIQVNSPKLLSFRLNAYTMPSLSFPISTTLEEITFRLGAPTPFGAYFFLKMREALELSLSSKYHVYIISHTPLLTLDMDVLDDLKTSLQFPPAENVETLSFETTWDECLWKENSPFFDVFFEICHPKLVSSKLLLRDVLEKKTTRTMANWPRYLKNFQIRSRHHQIWETPLNSRFLDWLPHSYADFKLEWSYS